MTPGRCNLRRSSVTPELVLAETVLERHVQWVVSPRVVRTKLQVADTFPHGDRMLDGEEAKWNFTVAPAALDQILWTRFPAHTCATPAAVRKPLPNLVMPVGTQFPQSFSEFRLLVATA